MTEADLRRLSPNEPWRVVRTRLRVQGVVPGPVETGQPSGHFTGTTGVTVYRGDAWPAKYRGNVLVGEVSWRWLFLVNVPLCLVPLLLGLRVVPHEGERTAAAREDRTRPSLGQQLALEQAPDPAHGHFRVPKVIASSEEKENF